VAGWHNVGADKMVGDEELEVGSTTGTLQTRVTSGDLEAASSHAEASGRPDDLAPPAPVKQPISPTHLRRWLVASDAVALAIALSVATIVQAWVRPIPAYIRTEQFKLALVALPLWLVAMGLNRLFTARALVRRSEEFRRLVSANALGTGLIVGLGFLVKFRELSRLWVALVFVCATVVLTVSRGVARHFFAWMRRQGYCSRPVVIVGTGVDALSVLHTTQRHPEFGYKVVGLTGDEIGERGGVRVLGGIEDSLRVIEETGAVGAILSVPSLEPEAVNRLTRQLGKAGHHVTLSSALHDIDISRARPQEIDGRLMIYVEPTGLSGWRRLCKRAFDIAVSSIVLLLTSPLIMLSAAAIKLTSRGPVVFSQVRVGRYGQEFRIFKLRTMVVDAEQLLDQLVERNEADGPLFKMTNDPRVTRVGHLLRKTSIDELPQLWNVLRGDMSVVGPRPALPREAAKWTPDLHERLQVLPGITGMWQVSGRSGADFEQYKRLDLYYVDNWSLWRDLSIVARTVGVVVLGRGAH
jgi:exopolysaccharide biosynthesis polyprenyl glycosylphosphotransferase